MEKWQRDFIWEHSADLIELTDCHAQFLARLYNITINGI